MGLSVLIWNINSLSDSKVCLHDYVTVFLAYDIILLCETRTTFVDASLFPGYSVAFQPSESPGTAGQGLLIAVKRSCYYGVQDWSSDHTSLWVRLLFSGSCFPPLYVGCVYVPPAGSPQLSTCSLEERFAALEHTISAGLAGGTVLLGGDFNAKVAVGVGSSVGPSKPFGQNKHGSALLDLCSVTGLSLCTGHVPGDYHAPPTFHSTSRSAPTRPDHALACSGILARVTSMQVLPHYLGSDHYPIHLKLGYQLPPQRRLVSGGTRMPNIKWAASCRVPYATALHGRADDLHRVCSLASEGHVASSIRDFYSIIASSAQEAGLLTRVRGSGLPTRTLGSSPPRPSPAPFFDRECLCLKQQFRRLARREGYTPDVKALERRYHSIVRAKKRQWLLHRLQEVVAEFYSNPRGFWRILRGPMAPLPGPLQDHSAWHEYLSALCRPLADVHEVVVPLDICPDLRPAPATRLHEPFSLVEVEVCLQAMHTGKASGFSGIPSELLRFAQLPTPDGEPPAPHLLVPCLQGIVNGLFGAGKIPRHCNVLTISPVLKDARGDLLNPGNYRPIAVPESLIRLYSSALNRRLMSYLEDEGLRCDANTGSRPGYSTMHNIFALQHFIDRASPDRPLYCCFLDLSKAFDRVPRYALWVALQRLGIQGQFLEAIKSVYEDADLTVVVDGYHGPIRPSQAGITQGSPLSPTLFGIVGDSLIRYIQSRCPDVGPSTVDGFTVPILGYVDDFVLMASSARGLQLLMNAVADWCDIFNMVVNCSKTRLMVFTGLSPVGLRTLEPLHITYRGQSLEVVQQIRYLGLIFSSCFGLGATFPHLRGRMQLAWGTLLSQYGRLQAGVSIGLLLRLLTTCVTPAGSYGCETWAFRNFGPGPPMGASALRVAYLSMIRHIAGVRLSVSTPVLLRELDVAPLEDTWLIRVVRFWNSLVSLPEGHLFAKIARGDCYLGVTTRSPTWAASIMKEVLAVGYPYAIDAHRLHPIDVPAIKELLRSRASRSWHDLSVIPQLCPSGRAQACSYHRWFRRPARVSRSALLFLRVPVTRLRVFFRFRMGVHGLPIDSGRRRGVPRHLRLCDMCHMEVVGDEHHFIFVCPALDPVRQRYRQLFATGSRSLRLFIWQQDLCAVVHFVSECFALRSTILSSEGNSPSHQPQLAGRM